MATCTLTLLDDERAEYEDDVFYQREADHHVSGQLGGDRLVRDVVALLSNWLEIDAPCHRSELTLLGRCLYEIAFGAGDPLSAEAPPLRRAFEKTFQKHRSSSGDEALRLRIVIMSEARKMATYPWEFLYMPISDEDGFFVAGQDTRLLLTRYIPNTDVRDDSRPDDEERLRILCVASTPVIPGMTTLQVEDFVKDLDELDEDRFDVRVEKSPSREALKRALAEHRPHVVHLIGHGRGGQIALRHTDEVITDLRERFDDDRAAGRSPLPVSEADWLDVVTARELLCHRGDAPRAPDRLIFLHACQGASVRHTRDALDTYSSLARALASRDRVTAVVAMQYEIGVEDATEFARYFYYFISEGLSLDAAVAQARKEFTEAPTGGRQAWDDRTFGTPVIYVRRNDPLVIAPVRTSRAPVDEHCPARGCGGTVNRRGAKKICATCGVGFAECPNGCGGLIALTPDSACATPGCGYVFAPSAVAGGGGRPRVERPRPPGGPEAAAGFEARDDGRTRPGGFATGESAPIPEPAPAAPGGYPVERYA